MQLCKVRTQNYTLPEKHSKYEDYIKSFWFKYVIYIGYF